MRDRLDSDYNCMDGKEGRNRGKGEKTATAESVGSFFSVHFDSFQGVCVHANHSGTVMDQMLTTKCSILCFPPISALFLPPTHTTLPLCLHIHTETLTLTLLLSASK